MEDFPSFMKDPLNKVPAGSQNTADVEGYFYEGAGGGQMAFWTCARERVSRRHVHAFDEYMVVVAGKYTACFEDREVELGPGDELLIPAGTEQWGRSAAGTRTIHAFGGRRVRPGSAEGRG